MYEETKSSIDWKGLFLKVIIAFLVIIIGVKAYTTLKGNSDKKETTTTKTVAESKSSSTFTANIEKLRDAGEKYFSDNKDKLPTTEGTTSMITLNELIDKGVISSLSDENGKTCDGESSYVTAVLENKQTKIKANLVCGSASSYSLVYMGENDSDITEETKTTETSSNSGKTSTSTKTVSSSSNNSSNKTTATKTTTNNCGNACSTPSISVTTNTTATQTVTIKEDTSSKNDAPTNNVDKPVNNNNNTNNVVAKKTYYTVRFKSNGGEKTYPNQTVLENDVAYNPGTTYKDYYIFKGWYLNGEKYDFSTPVTEDITLVAKFIERDYEEYYDYEDEYDYTSKREFTTKVYSLGWDERGTKTFKVSHTLKLPNTIKNGYDFDTVRIKRVEYSAPLNQTHLLTAYNNRFNDTFIYTRTGSEKYLTSKDNLATINSRAVDIDADYDYKTRSEALYEGFDVNWNASYISSQCTRTFSVTNSNTNATAYNLCGYGIVYDVTWEILY